MLEHRPGVYYIKCIVNDQLYVGSSKDVQARIWSHQSALRHNKHSNPKLQNSWNAHGEQSFMFELFEYVDGGIGQLVEREQYYIDTMKPHYNSRLIAESNVGKLVRPESVELMKQSLTGLKRTQETKDRIGEARRGYKNSPESIQRMRDAHANISDETRLRMSVAKIGIEPKKATEAAANANIGKHRLQATKDLISAKKKGKPVANQANASKAGADKTRGKPRSEATSAKIAATVARKKALGLTKHSPETIARIKVARQKK